MVLVSDRVHEILDFSPERYVVISYIHRRMMPGNSTG
jgi:hypothetical protein